MAVTFAGELAQSEQVLFTADKNFFNDIDGSMKNLEGSLDAADNKKPSVLIVDDDAAVRRFLSKVFKKLDLPFIAVETGEQAVDYGRKMPFDVAFIDMVLPGINGVQTLKKIKELNPKVKAVVFTGFRENKMIEEALELGAQAVLDKPFSVTEIFGVMSRMISPPDTGKK